MCLLQAVDSLQPVISAPLCLFTNITCYSAGGPQLLCAVVCIFDVNGYLVCTMLIVCLSQKNSSAIPQLCQLTDTVMHSCFMIHH